MIAVFSYYYYCYHHHHLVIELKCVSVKTCPSPKAPENGAVICSNNDHIIDTECEFSCLPGHTLVGSRHRSCLPLARWDGLHTTCKRRYNFLESSKKLFDKIFLEIIKRCIEGS